MAGNRTNSEQLELKAVRLSRSCHQVLRYLREKKGLHSANDIYMALKSEFSEDAPGLTTIYRSLETLVQSERVQSVVLGDSEKIFEYIEDGQHHHHLICTSCRTSVHLHKCFIEQWEEKIKTVHGFEVRSHILELFGLCPECQTSATAPLN